MKIITDMVMSPPPCAPNGVITMETIIEAIVEVWIEQYVEDAVSVPEVLSNAIEYLNAAMGIEMGKSDVHELMGAYVEDMCLQTYEAVDQCLKRLLPAVGKNLHLTFHTVKYPTIIIEAI